jgi:organic radical activating enzyme
MTEISHEVLFGCKIPESEKEDGYVIINDIEHISAGDKNGDFYGYSYWRIRRGNMDYIVRWGDYFGKPSVHVHTLSEEDKITVRALPTEEITSDLFIERNLDRLWWDKGNPRPLIEAQNSIDRRTEEEKIIEAQQEEKRTNMRVPVGLVGIDTVLETLRLKLYRAEKANMHIAESFYSVQGEGVTCGVPSYFVRLRACNLRCGGPAGSLVSKGKASWWCDTEGIWDKAGGWYTPEELEDKVRVEGEELGVDIIGGLVDGTIHFIWTGGEPTMDHNVEAIKSFLHYWGERYPENESFHEIETNGTIETDLYLVMDQINCSAKLANSGMKAPVRIVPKAIAQIASHPNHWWKFVVNCESEETAFLDLKEIEEDYLIPFNLDKRRLVIMPGVDRLEDLPDVTRVLYEVAKKYGCRAVTRGHVLAWDKTTGV